MAPLPRTQFGNPILRTKTEAVPTYLIGTPALTQLIEAMFYTIREIGVGLAAPQIGTSLRLAVIHIRPLKHRPNAKEFRRVLINPEILEYSAEEEAEYEGCLSFDGLRAEAHRSKKVKVRYLDENGKEQTEWAEGFPAKVFQHEIDHLNGTLFVDRVRDNKTIMTTEEFARQMQGT